MSLNYQINLFKKDLKTKIHKAQTNYNLHHNRNDLKYLKYLEHLQNHYKWLKRDFRNSNLDATDFIDFKITALSQYMSSQLFHPLEFKALISFQKALYKIKFNLK
jgi:hypothetical protein